MSKPINYKYKELENIKSVAEYINKTYSAHYTSSNNIQVMDLVMADDWGEGFLQGNIIKYASRANKKGTARQDIMKIIHYALLWLHKQELASANIQTNPENNNNDN